MRVAWVGRDNSRINTASREDSDNNINGNNNQESRPTMYWTSRCLSCNKSFTIIIWFHPQSNPLLQILLLFPFNRWYSRRAKTLDLQRPGFKFQLCFFSSFVRLSVYLTSESFSFFSCKVEIIIVPLRFEMRYSKVSGIYILGKWSVLLLPRKG